MPVLPKQLSIAASALLPSSSVEDNDATPQSGGRLKPQFTPIENGCVEHDGLIMPADMSDELKNLNVYVDQTTFDVRGRAKNWVFEKLFKIKTVT